MPSAQEPHTAAGRALHARLSHERWLVVAARAMQRAVAYEAVMAEQARAGGSRRAALARACPEVPWPTLVRWNRRVQRGEGPLWERLLDLREPPHVEIPQEIRDAACLLRRVDLSINTETARQRLVSQYGARGAVSDAVLRRLWKAAQLSYVRPPRPTTAGAGQAGGQHRDEEEEQQEEVEPLSGGFGLALLAAAEAELGCVSSLAESAFSAGQARSKAQELSELDDVDDGADRGAGGKFSASYNTRRRGTTPPGQADGRWASDADKAKARSLSQLQTLERPAEVLARRLLAMAVSPMLLNSRGFDGLTAPHGAWLAALGGPGYMPATLDKTLAELGLLNVADDLWRTHARFWFELSQRWCDPQQSWLRTAVYIDGTGDPYWTSAFAKSGKVSRVGRVMPCLTRVAVNSGAGVPLLIETHVGAVSLKKRLLPMLKELSTAAGPAAQLRRLVVVDSEAGTAGMLWALSEQAGAVFISVIKGHVLAGAVIHHCGPWQPYRQQDQLREVDLTIHGKDAPDGRLRLRAVEMRRAGGRQPRSTTFATSATQEELITAAVADHYLRRWPLQEQVFRDARKAGVLSRSHGFGGGQVAHVALVDKLDAAKRAVEAGWNRLDQADLARSTIAEELADSPARTTSVRVADKQVATAERALRKRQAALAALQTMPTEIRQRDTGRDSIMTCLKMTAMTLVEFVLKEYFGGLSMEWRTFIDQLVAMPVTLRTSRSTWLVQVQANPRNPQLMRHIEAAVAEVNKRELRRGQQRVVFEILPTAGGGS